MNKEEIINWVLQNNPDGKFGDAIWEAYNKAKEEIIKEINKIPDIKNDVGIGISNEENRITFRAGYENGRSNFKQEIKSFMDSGINNKKLNIPFDLDVLQNFLCPNCKSQMEWHESVCNKCEYDLGKLGFKEKK